MKKILIVFVILASLPFCSGKKTGEIKAPGIIEGDIITIKSLVTGTIEQIFIKEGEPVKPNQQLITINNEKIQNQIEELKTQLKAAKDAADIQFKYDELEEKTALELTKMEVEADKELSEQKQQNRPEQ